MSLDPRLDGRAALVTGAGGGTGSACARALGEAGAAVLVADVDAGAARRVAGQLSADGIRAEPRRHPGRAPYRGRHRSRRRRGDGRVLPGRVRRDRRGGEQRRHSRRSDPPLADFELDWWDRTLAINLSSVFYCLKYELRAMREQGRGGSIVNTGSIYAQVAHPGVSAISPPSTGSSG